MDSASVGFSLILRASSFSNSYDAVLAVIYLGILSISLFFVTYPLPFMGRVRVGLFPSLEGRVRVGLFFFLLSVWRSVTVDSVLPPLHSPDVPFLSP